MGFLLLVEHKMNVEDRSCCPTVCIYLACSCVRRIDAELNGKPTVLVSEKCLA
jgi:hypothetical protein